MQSAAAEAAARTARPMAVALAPVEMPGIRPQVEAQVVDADEVQAESREAPKVVA